MQGFMHKEILIDKARLVIVALLLAEKNRGRCLSSNQESFIVITSREALLWKRPLNYYLLRTAPLFEAPLSW